MPESSAATTSRRVLLRSSWATVNIGDVAHTPGALRVLEGLPETVDVTLWPARLQERERRLITDSFPRVRIVDGELDRDGRPTTAALGDAWEAADVLVHGSAAGLFTTRELRSWARLGKPYGYFGVTSDPFGPHTPSTLAQAKVQVAALSPDYLDPMTREVVEGAEFVHCRDSLTLDYLRGQGVTTPGLAFGPDATFACDVRDDDGADRLLASLGLTGSRFLVVVPRARYAPYHEIYGHHPEQIDLRKAAINAAHTPDEMALLGSAITHWVRTTGHRVVVGPEMNYAVELAHQYFPRTLAPDVRDRVHVIDEFWHLPVATAVFAQAEGVLSMECHSPILASTSGTPFMYLRQPTETFKGQMYHDLGAGAAVVEVASPDAGAALSSLLEEIADRPESARERSRAANERALVHLRRMGSIAAGATDPASDHEVGSTRRLDPIHG